MLPLESEVTLAMECYEFWESFASDGDYPLEKIFEVIDEILLNSDTEPF
jgi:hypothetical protein